MNLSEAKGLQVEAEVCHWDDAKVNGVEDVGGELIPCRVRGYWAPLIRLDDGLIAGWPSGVEASIHYKVCDQGQYWLTDSSGNKIAKWRDHYVPDDLLCIGDEGYGDYIILDVGGDGRIKGWKKPEIEAEGWELLPVELVSECVEKEGSMQVKVKKLHQDAALPVRATEGAAAFDLVALSAIRDGLETVCRTGLSFEIPAGHAMFIYSRSGHGFNAATRLANCVGVIDSDYRGEVMVKLRHDNPMIAPFIGQGDRVAQAVIMPVPAVEFVLADELSDTARGAGGFGSTGAQ